MDLMVRTVITSSTTNHHVFTAPEHAVLMVPINIQTIVVHKQKAYDLIPSLR